ncbi:MAG TPA: enoyl-CoA hydratase [Pseudonocardiaceae bacterium]|nr:enoyl-CoA hydratase [Pseudonocardiaceae bacterium]
MTGAEHPSNGSVNINVSDTAEFLVNANGGVLTVVFNRPAQRNAMTWAMYEGLVAACERADADPAIRTLVLRGAGGAAFVAGTDIAQFAAFRSGQDAVDYERKTTAILTRLAEVRVPTVAVIDGFCVGAGLAIASACDLRISRPGARFGVPIARTVGNCLSAATMALIAGRLGPARTMDLLLTARLATAEELAPTGFLAEITEELDGALARLVGRLAGHAPLTMWATKAALLRLREAVRVEDADIIERVYGSADFRAGVAAFGAKQTPEWTGE